MDGRSEREDHEWHRSAALDGGLDEPFGHVPDEHGGTGGGIDDGFVLPTPRVLPVAAPLSVDRIPDRYRRSASASVLAASLLGLRDIIEPPEEDEVVIDQHADERDGARSIEVYLDPDDPAASLVVIRNPADLN